jgi:hypothetical protein
MYFTELSNTVSAFHRKLFQKIANDVYELFRFIRMNKMGGTGNNK